MCDDWIIDSYETILVEMKLKYKGLKGNQGIMVTNESIYVLVWLKWYDLWYDWMWSLDVTILVEMKPEY